MTTLVCQPPTTTLTLHIEFVDTNIINVARLSSLPWDRRQTYKVFITLLDKNGVVLGDMLCKLYEVMKWPRMRLRCETGFF
jgi:hypothetical protein